MFLPELFMHIFASFVLETKNTVLILSTVFFVAYIYCKICADNVQIMCKNLDMVQKLAWKNPPNVRKNPPMFGKVA